MNTKLTLNIDDKIVRKAKVYAKSKGRSLSDLVESLLKTITSTEVAEAEMSTRIKSLAGSISFPDDFDYKAELTESLSKKHSK